MEIAEELYREVVLDHYKNPRNRGLLEKPNVRQEGANPLCGDELEIDLRFGVDKIEDIRFHGKGCSISQASASIMTEAVRGRPIAEVRRLIEDFKGLMLEGKSGESLPEALEDARALEGVKKYPVRIKCALLAWYTLLEGLKKYD